MTTVPLRSMTGFGESERDLLSGRLSVSVRTVNHRYLNIQLRIPPGSERHQAALERTLRERFVRGHVTVSITLDRSTTANGALSVAVDMERARAYVAALRSVRDELQLEGQVEIGLLPWFRDIFREPDQREAPTELALEELTELVSEASRRALLMREEEGRRLAVDLSGRLDAMETTLGELAERAPHRLVAERDRLRTVVGELLGDESRVDEERLAREIAYIAERLDLHEEIVRFRSHLEMFRGTLRTGDQGGIGKRFGFIAQELLREANTMGSKANDAEVARLVVLLKEEIERLREQLENVE